MHARVLEEEWCGTCLREDNQEIEDSFSHSLYDYKHTTLVIRGVSKYFFKSNRLHSGGEGIQNPSYHKQTNISSLLLNYALYSIIKGNKALVPEIIIREVTIQLATTVKLDHIFSWSISPSTSTHFCKTKRLQHVTHHRRDTATCTNPEGLTLQEIIKF